MDKCWYRDSSISKDLTFLIHDELKKVYPQLNFTINTIKEYNDKGYETFVTYQIKRGWKFFGKWFGKTLVDICCKKPEEIHYYDKGIEKALDNLKSYMDITKIYHENY